MKGGVAHTRALVMSAWCGTVLMACVVLCAGDLTRSVKFLGSLNLVRHFSTRAAIHRPV